MASSSSSIDNLLLSGWSPVTTRLLQEGGADAWNYVDGILREDSAKLYSELEGANLWNKLKPARTQGDAKMDKMLGLLQGATDSSLYSRGDLSLFLSREYRSREDFPARHPFLQRLISSVTATVTTKLKDRIDFDVSLTSVQLARYPGDGSSGYVRHCDRKGACCQEEKTSSTSIASFPERIITAIYYLTDDDWNVVKDGGCLRLFLSGKCKETEQFVDVPPYRDRLIIFRSDGVEHQVLPSLRRPRTAITVWLYGVERIKQEDALIPSFHTNEETPSGNNHTFDHPCKQVPAGLPPLPLPINLPNKAMKTNNNAKLPTVFVSIAAYRDSETGPTLCSLFSTARYPTEISVGLVLQLDQYQDSDILKSIVSTPYYNSNVRCLRMEARDALGPCFARALCQSLFRGEDYVLQIDSHMRFRKDWDAYLIQLLQDTRQRTHNPKIVLTTYPVGYTLPDIIPTETRGTLLVPWKFDDKNKGILRQRGRLLSSLLPNAAIPCHLYAGGFNFAPAQVLKDVPYDQFLHELFFGEELSMAVRLYTHGYDLYAPPETVCFHLWSRSHRPTQIPDEDPRKLESRRLSLAIVQKQLRGEKQCISSCGLGMIRTAAHFSEVLGVDFEQEIITRDDFEHGCLKPSNFADNTADLYPPESIEAKVATLDAKVQEHIALFLDGMAANQ